MGQQKTLVIVIVVLIVLGLLTYWFLRRGQVQLPVQPENSPAGEQFPAETVQESPTGESQTPTGELPGSSPTQ